MKLHRIYAIVLRFMFLFRRSYDRMSDVFYWPFIDILIWGLTSAYFQSLSADSERIMSVLLGGLILWFVVWRAQYEISVNLLEDLWNKNLVNIFVAPTKFSEWIVAFFLIGLLKIVISVSFAAALSFALYRVNFFEYGWYLLPAIPILTMTGWAIGVTVSSIILRYGTKVQTLAWTLTYIVSPFAAIYYPLGSLPPVAQNIAKFIPLSYVFENARNLLTKGTINPNDLLIAFGLSFLYLCLGLLFLRNSFDKVLDKGLVKVY
ncbi:MAG: ABC transporter permease [Weeksellaceae bacterium]